MSKKTVSPWLALPVILIVLIAAGAAAAWLVINAPQAEKKQRPKMAALVDTQPLKISDETAVLHLTGTVIPAQHVLLRARVSGEIVSIAPDFIEGGFLEKAAPVLNIDPADYKLALAKAESSLETARFNYKLELGRQDVAKREWELLKSDDASRLEQELALRIPHLAASKAALEAAEAALERARLDLERTDIRAPFNAVVLSRKVNIGSQASPQDVLAEIAGTDVYWVQVSVPVDRLEWIEIPGSRVRILSASGAVREGKVIKLLGNLEEKGRMARLLVEVEDPLCRMKYKGCNTLLLGEYVRAEIDGRRLTGVYRIPRQALREDAFIWIATPDSKLDIRKVEVLWRDSRQVLIRDGIQADEELIVSDITVPVDGMAVNTGRNMKPADPAARNGGSATAAKMKVDTD